MGFQEIYGKPAYDNVVSFLEQHDINIVTCGECGGVLGHSFSDTEITCPKCKFTSEPCYFPDLFY